MRFCRNFSCEGDFAMLLANREVEERWHD
jgi:hypothetical protein